VRASAETKARLGPFQPQPAPIEAITAGLRAKFDPKNILNTGLMQPRQEG
jgi:glycolate oxidase FAD binding subunit